MKRKDYRKKRLEIKKAKRGMKDIHFLDKSHEKAFKEDLKRTYRANKRSEKQAIQQEINEELS